MKINHFKKLLKVFTIGIISYGSISMVSAQEKNPLTITKQTLDIAWKNGELIDAIFVERDETFSDNDLVISTVLTFGF